jgi:hypothetical protein
MACHELPSAVEDHVAVDDVRRRAAALAGQMTDWLIDPDNDPTLYAPADLEQWCRSARDVLEELARG